MAISDPTIVAGDTIYEVTSSGLVAVGTATTNGSVTISFSSDPTFVVTTTTLTAQSSLTITTLSGTVGKPLTLTTSGGSGTGAVTYTVANGTANGCTISGGSLTSKSAGTCVVVATKSADSTYLSISSSPTTITMGARALPARRMPLRVSGRAVAGATVVLTISGSGFYGQPGGGFIRPPHGGALRGAAGPGDAQNREVPNG
jgi:hypothetical protein